MSRALVFGVFLLIFSSSAMAQFPDSTHAINSPSNDKPNSDVPQIPNDRRVEFLEALNDTLDSWSKFHYDFNLSTSVNKLMDIADETMKRMYKVFMLSKDLEDWLKPDNSTNDSSTILYEIKNATDKIVTELEKMDDEIYQGFLQVPDHQVRGGTTFYRLIEEEIKNYSNLLKVYFNGSYQNNFTTNYDYGYNSALDILHNKVNETFNMTINYDPLNDQLFNDIANMFVAAIKQLIMFRAAFEAEISKPDDFSKNAYIENWPESFGATTTRKILEDINWKNFIRKDDFKNIVMSTIQYYLRERTPNSKTSQNIFTNLTKTFEKYDFAVAVFDVNFNISFPPYATEGNVYLVDGYMDKNAFVIPNQKPRISSQKDYVECPFWDFLNENEICEKANGKNISYVMKMIQEKCPGVTDIAVIKMVPHSIIGYVSPKFDRDANAFSVSGFGLGGCFHYSIWIANKLIN